MLCSFLLAAVFSRVWKPWEDLAGDQVVLDRLGCALQPIACGVSGGPCVYLSLCFAYWLVSSLVNNFLDNNKAGVVAMLSLLLL